MDDKVLQYNIFAALHNMNLVVRAKELINNFIDDDSGVIYVVNPDGTSLKLQKGVDLIAINGLGIIKEK